MLIYVRSTGESITFFVEGGLLTEMLAGNEVYLGGLSSFDVVFFFVMLMLVIEPIAVWLKSNETLETSSTVSAFGFFYITQACSGNIIIILLCMYL